MTVTLYRIFIFLSSFYFVFHCATKNVKISAGTEYMLLGRTTSKKQKQKPKKLLNQTHTG